MCHNDQLVSTKVPQLQKQQQQQRHAELKIPELYETKSRYPKKIWKKKWSCNRQQLLISFLYYNINEKKRYFLSSLPEYVYNPQAFFVHHAYLNTSRHKISYLESSMFATAVYTEDGFFFPLAMIGNLLLCTSLPVTVKYSLIRWSNHGMNNAERTSEKKNQSLFWSLLYTLFSFTLILYDGMVDVNKQSMWKIHQQLATTAYNDSKTCTKYSS